MLQKIQPTFCLTIEWKKRYTNVWMPLNMNFIFCSSIQLFTVKLSDFTSFLFQEENRILHERETNLKERERMLSISQENLKTVAELEVKQQVSAMEEVAIKVLLTSWNSCENALFGQLNWGDLFEGQGHLRFLNPLALCKY